MCLLYVVCICDNFKEDRFFNEIVCLKDKGIVCDFKLIKLY